MATAYTSPLLVPQMLDWIRVWGHSGPMKDVDGVCLKNVLWQSCRIFARNVLLEI